MKPVMGLLETNMQRRINQCIRRLCITMNKGQMCYEQRIIRLYTKETLCKEIRDNHSIILVVIARRAHEGSA
jgi:hypothetical protein